MFQGYDARVSDKKSKDYRHENTKNTSTPKMTSRCPQLKVINTKVFRNVRILNLPHLCEN